MLKTTAGPVAVLGDTVPRSRASPKTGQLSLMARKAVSWVFKSVPLDVNVPRTTVSWPLWNVVLELCEVVSTVYEHLGARYVRLGWSNKQHHLW